MGRLLSIIVELGIIAGVALLVILEPRAMSRLAGTPPANERLRFAAWTGDDVGFTQALSEGAAINACDSSGGTALAYAAQSGKLATAERLLRLGADVNAGDGNGVTPLMLATMGDHVSMVRLLVQSGADRSARAQVTRLTALDMAIMHDSSECVAALSEGDSAFQSDP